MLSERAVNDLYSSMLKIIAIESGEYHTIKTYTSHANALSRICSQEPVRGWAQHHVENMQAKKSATCRTRLDPSATGTSIHSDE